MKTPTNAEAIRLKAPPVGHFDELDRLCVTTLRTLAMDAVQQANSGHQAPDRAGGGGARGELALDRSVRAAAG